MTRTRLGLLGICAALFGLMALSASAAQAEVSAKWLLAKSDGTLVNFLEATLNLETDVPLVLHMEISKAKILFLCATVTMVNAALKANGSIGNGAKVRFSGCTTDLNGVVSKSCEPSNQGTEPGVLVSRPLHGLLILHKLLNGTVDDLIKVLPDEGETFFTLEMSKECAIGTKINVIGSAALKDCQGLGRAHLVKHLVEVGGWGTELTELWAVSKTDEHKVFILGSAWASLAGAHTGFKFSGDPA